MTDWKPLKISVLPQGLAGLKEQLIEPMACCLAPNAQIDEYNPVVIRAVLHQMDSHLLLVISQTAARRHPLADSAVLDFCSHPFLDVENQLE